MYYILLSHKSRAYLLVLHMRPTFMWGEGVVHWVHCLLSFNLRSANTIESGLAKKKKKKTLWNS